MSKSSFKEEAGESEVLRAVSNGMLTVLVFPNYFVTTMQHIYASGQPVPSIEKILKRSINSIPAFAYQRFVGVSSGGLVSSSLEGVSSSDTPYLQSAKTAIASSIGETMFSLPGEVTAMQKSLALKSDIVTTSRRVAIPILVRNTGFWAGKVTSERVKTENNIDSKASGALIGFVIGGAASMMTLPFLQLAPYMAANPEVTFSEALRRSVKMPDVRVAGCRIFNMGVSTAALVTAGDGFFSFVNRFAGANNNCERSRL